MEDLFPIQNRSDLKDILIRVGDLVNFEGPLLTLYYKIDTSKFFLFDWVDRDKESNRWIIYHATARKIYEYITNKISHFELIESASKPYCYSDISFKNRSINDYQIFEVEDIPSVYIPDKEACFEEGDCPSLSKIKSVVKAVLDRSSGKIISSFKEETYRKAKRKITNRIKKSSIIYFKENFINTKHFEITFGEASIIRPSSISAASVFNRNTRNNKIKSNQRIHV